MTQRSITLRRKWESSALFSLGVVSSGVYLHTAGITARDENGDVVAPGDMRKQVQRVFETLGEILQAAGASWENVVKYTIFATDVRAYNDSTRDIRAKYFPARPAATAVEVRSLVHPDMVVEIEAVVCLPSETLG